MLIKWGRQKKKKTQKFSGNIHVYWLYDGIFLHCKTKKVKGKKKQTIQLFFFWVIYSKAMFNISLNIIKLKEQLSIFRNFYSKNTTVKNPLNWHAKSNQQIGTELAKSGKKCAQFLISLFFDNSLKNTIWSLNFFY